MELPKDHDCEKCSCVFPWETGFHQDENGLCLACSGCGDPECCVHDESCVFEVAKGDGSFAEWCADAHKEPTAYLFALWLEKHGLQKTDLSGLDSVALRDWNWQPANLEWPTNSS